MKRQMAMLGALAVVLAAGAKPSFFLPERIFAAPGLELNVYYKNVFDSVVPQNFAYEATCRKGCAELARWCFTPEAADAGNSYELVLSAWNDDGLVASVTSMVVVAAAAADPAKRVTLALLGDSLTNCGFQDQALRMMRGHGYSGYTPVGSRTTGSNGIALHDGYGGFTFGAFLTRYRFSEEEVANIQDTAEREQLKALGMPVKIIHKYQRDLLRSPLVRFEKGEKRVDVRAWLDKVNGGVAPDIIVIELGVNSVFKYAGDVAAIRERIRRDLIPEAKGFIDRLRQDMPDATYFLCTQPGGTNQDGFGASYGARASEQHFRKVIFSLNREYDAFVKELNDPRVILMPLAHAVDPYEAFVQRKLAPSAHSRNNVVRQTNALHLSELGGLQMGDTMAAALMVHFGQAK